MTPEDARKLLGGYATGTLTEAEEQALFAAALEDQELFDSLAREQGLRDLLRDPSAKAGLLAALDQPRRQWWRSWKPAAVLAMAGVAAVAVVVGTRKAPAPVTMMARVEAPASAFVTPQAAPVSEAAPEKPRTAEAKRLPPPAVPKPEADAAAPAKLLKAEAPAPPAPPVAVAESKASAPTPGERRDAAPASTQQQVQVTAMAPPLAQQGFVQSDTQMQLQALADAQAARPSARAMFLGVTQPVVAIAARSAAPQALGLRYSIVRREDTVAIRFTANMNGYLAVGGAAPVAMTARQPYTTGPLAGDEVKVVFSRQPEPGAPNSAVPVTEVSGGETYIAIPAGPLGFTIPLKQP